MLYQAMYNGPKIDELLEAISHIKTVVNGWVKLESSEDNKINFDELINPGNFSFSYWENGPTNKDFTPPLNVVVTKEGKYLRQYVFNSGFNDTAFSRIYSISNKSFDSWEDVSIPDGAYAQDTAPMNPKENELWFNTNGTAPIIKYYDNTTNSWKSVNPYDYMDPTIYNPDGTEFARGIYQQVDEKVKNISGGTVTVDFRGHINDSTIHLSVTEKASADNKMRSDILLTSIQKVVDSLSEYIAEEAPSSGVDISAVELLAIQVKKTLTDHANDVVKHPSAAQIANWNSKADKDHTHNVNEITLNASDVVGEITLDIIPEEAKEKQVNVKSNEEMLALTKEQIHNGCFVFVKPDDSNGGYLYVVADDTKLGTMDAFLCFSTPAVELKWENVEGKPTTLEELGLTSNETDEAVDKMVTEVNTTTTEAETSVNNIYDTAKHGLDNQDNSFAMENLIDLIDYKMQLIQSLISNS